MALALATCAAAFAPLPAARAPELRATGVSMGLESELGATGPLLPYWDPLGLVRVLWREKALPCALCLGLPGWPRRD